MILPNHNSQHEDKPPFSSGEAASVNRFLALVMQESADIFGLLTPRGEIQELSPSWHTFTGQEENEYRGQGWLEAFHSADQPQVEETLIQTIASGRSSEWTCQIRRHDESYRLVHWRLIPLRESSGTLFEIVVCGTDITTQEQAKQMREAEKQLALHTPGVGLWDWDCLTHQFMWTEQEKALFGWSPDTSVTHERFLEAVHPDDRERVNRISACTLVEQREHHADYRVIWPDRSIHWLSDRASSRVDARGKLVRLVGATVDITTVKQAEERITTLLESITDTFSHVDTQWCYTYVNRGWEKMMGKQWEEVVGRSLWDTFPEILGTPFERVYREAMATQQARHIEGFHPIFRRWLDSHINPTPDGLSFELHDITERKQAEEALRESEAGFRGLMEDSNVIGVLIAELDGTIREANNAFLSLVGYTQDDVATGQMNWRAMTAPEYQEQSAQAVEKELVTGMFTPFEKEYVTKDGKRVPVLVGGTLFRREGSARWEIAFVLDLTARKEIERQKDLFLGMTGHELKTPLAALRGTLQLVQRRLKRVVTAEDYMSPGWKTFVQGLTKNLEDSVRQIDVQTRLINDLLDVSRITARTLKLELERCELGSIVRETVEDLRVTAPERSLLLEVPKQTKAYVLADRDRISQVVSNYVTNALRYSHPDQPVHVGLTIQEEAARVWVRDAGAGFTEEAKTQLWQRFHQVKGVPVLSGSGKGLGLGLYICQTLIAQHQVEVGVESTPGEGSTFWFTLSLVT
jgi:PAS domain S-box-containing protein